jgi:3-oxoacyl-[acyl-carrier protein] reductase
MLKNKKIIITGATGGIGSAISLLFAKNNAELILVGRSMNKLNNLKSKILKFYKVNISIFAFDISDYEETKIVFKNIFSRFKNIDVLVNNAGILKDNFIGMIPKKDMDNIMNINLIGPIIFTQLVSKIITKKNSSIINISSIVGKSGNSGQTIYSSSKSGLLGFTFSAAKEFASRAIRVNAIAPGLIKTKMIRGIPKEQYSKLMSSISMKRIGKPIDVANVALFLASDLSTYITGQVIGVDGGMTI